MRKRALIPLALVALLVGGCRQPLPSGGLPDALAAVVSHSDGGLMSVLIELPRPGVDPKVRLAEGALAIDQGWARAWVDGAAEDGRVRCELIDLSGARSRELEVYGDVELHRLDRDGAVVRRSGQLLRLPMNVDQRPAPLATDPGPGGQATHKGPAGGFALRVLDGRLDLRLPRTDGTAWSPLLYEVDHLVGSWWIELASLPPWQRRLVDDRFKQVGVVPGLPGSAVADGRLDEWRGDQALPVDDPSQILFGQEGWHGERDASFGVAARHGPDGFVLAVRVRDDFVVPGEDQLILRTSADELVIPLQGRREELDLGAARVVLADRRGWDQGLEIELHGIELSELVVQLLDADPQQAPTLLATAPYPGLLARGALILEPRGPARPEPQ